GSGVQRPGTGFEQGGDVFLGLVMLGNDLQEGAPPGVLTIHVMAGGLEHIQEAGEVMGPQAAIGTRQHVVVHRLVTMGAEAEKHRDLFIGHRLANHLLLVFTHGQPSSVNSKGGDCSTPGGRASAWRCDYTGPGCREYADRALRPVLPWGAPGNRQSRSVVAIRPCDVNTGISMSNLSLPLFAALRDSFRQGYSLSSLRSDVLAGITVGIIAIPLAIAVGVAPQHGLYTGIVGGLIIALFGGSRFNISGPTAAFVVILLPITQAYGLGGLLLVTLMAGAILVALGVARMGNLIQFV